jgi:acetoin utilization protein AcuB
MEATMVKLTVRDWMTRDPITLTEEDLVQGAVEIFTDKKIRHIPVVRDGELVGMLTDRDIKSAGPPPSLGILTSEYKSFVSQTLLSEVMTPGPITCTPETDLLEIVENFLDYKFGAIPVVDGNCLVGIITQVDLLKACRKLLSDF